jgi:hypothetical protein
MWRCPVDLIRYVVKAVVLEGLSVRGDCPQLG